MISASVREVVAFVLRTGDLGSSAHFAGPNRALEGTRGHQRLRKKRPAGYQSEVVVQWIFETDEFTFQLKGRIDGVLVDNGSLLIEEIKTVDLPWSGPADPLHWAQAKIYAFLYAQDHRFDNTDIQITYLNLKDNQTVEFLEHFRIGILKAFFESVLNEYLRWIRDHHHWCRSRDRSIQELPFPFKEYRTGQRSLAVAVYRAAKTHGKLFAEAPTGIGKTISVLFPTIKAMGEGLVEKIFYLTAKTIGRTVAEESLNRLRSGGLRLRVVTVTAKDKICFNNGQPCDLRTCPLAIGYYDRIKTAIRDALKNETFTRTEIEDIARKHQVCPFELSLDLSVWMDAIICDYNYAFDPTASLKRYFDDEKHDYGILIDEAHNLVDRAREMFSAEVERSELIALKNAIESELPDCAKALRKIASRLSALHQDGEFIERDGTLVSKAAPARIAKLLERFLEEAELWLVQNESAVFRQALLDIYFRVLGFQRILELFDERYVTLYEENAGRLRLFCVDPSELLRSAVERMGSSVFFSATLSPMSYFRESLGGDEFDTMLQLDSPFPPENLSVLVQDRIPTTFRARSTSYDHVASAIVALVSGRTGNYLVFFPSYEYLRQVLDCFLKARDDIRIEVQKTGMSEFERERFLSQFQDAQDTTLVGFAVMGGIFGEGIDLIGERLIGVVVVGVGLPQICLERDLIREHCQRANRSGFDYAYTFPGMNRVLQAAGRVIRSDTDRGVVFLIDQRFGNRPFLDLFPTWWFPKAVRTPDQIAACAKAFWKNSDSTSETQNLSLVGE
jgi:DNA excision repair protein ERCC-2